jgi:hypothetical protein
MCSTCADTVFGEIDSAAAISRLVAPSPIRPAISISRAVSRGGPDVASKGEAGAADKGEPGAASEG